MRKRMWLLLLSALCLAAASSGCRRKPIETEAQTETQRASEMQTEAPKTTETEKQTDKQAGQTESGAKSGTETEKGAQGTTKRTTVTPSTTTPKPSASPSPSPKAQTQTKACPYCGNKFSTVTGTDGSSEYSSHVAQEEAYIWAIGGDPATYTSGSQSSSSDTSADTGSGNTGGDDLSGYQVGDDGSLYAQCPYCFQWFSDTADSSGYSPYAEHVAAEAAYAAQQNNEDYLQCPICGNWVTQSEYQVHAANGW